MKRMHIVVWHEGEYEDKSWLPLTAWEKRRDALNEADRLNDLSRQYQAAKREFRESPDLQLNEEQYDREYRKWSKERDALVSRHRRKMGLPCLDHYNEPRFSVASVVLRMPSTNRQDR